MRVNKCTLIYSILNNDSGLLSDAFYSVIFFIVALLISFFVYFHKENFLKKAISIVFVLYAAYITIPSVFSSFSRYFYLRHLYIYKNYKEITGKIDELKIKNIYNRYKIISFKVNGVNFKYDNVTITGGYNKLGKLKNKECVKIIYISEDNKSKNLKNLILYLEKCLYCKN